MLLRRAMALAMATIEAKAASLLWAVRSRCEEVVA
jgi:hypothetical protein